MPEAALVDEGVSRRRVVLAGGSGFLGSHLAPELVARGYEVVVLTRSPRPTAGPAIEVAWDGTSPGPWVESLDGAAAVVNLAGKSVNCRYTPENRRELVDSRVNSVRAIGQAIRSVATPPRAWIQAGSLAIYGDTRERCDERAPHGEGFSVDICKAWEGAFEDEPTPATRRALMRIGFALGRGGGALGTLENLVRCYLGGAAGSGRQVISWLHIADLNRMFRWAIERPEVTGIFNATGPNPLTNAEFMRALRRALGRSWGLPSPAWAVKIGAFLMRTEPSLALTGRRCVPARFEGLGFAFEFPELPSALHDLYGRAH